MIVDRTKELEPFVKTRHRVKISRSDPFYPFFELIRRTTVNLSDLSSGIDEYNEKVDEYFSSEDNLVKRGLGEELEEIQGVNTDLVKSTKENLKVIEKKYLKKDVGNVLFELQYKFVANSFLERCNKLFSSQQTFNKRKRREMRKRLSVAGNKLTQDELDDIAQSRKYDRMLQQYTESKVGTNVKYQIDLEVARMKEMKSELEVLMVEFSEVVDMFRDMFVLTSLQDSPIDDIQYMTEYTMEKVQKQTKVVRKLRKQRQKRCIIQ